MRQRPSQGSPSQEVPLKAHSNSAIPCSFVFDLFVPSTTHSEFSADQYCRTNQTSSFSTAKSRRSRSNAIEPMTGSSLSKPLPARWLQVCLTCKSTRERTRMSMSTNEPLRTLDESLSQPPGTLTSGSNAIRRVLNPSNLPPVVSTPFRVGFWLGSPLNHSIVPSISLVRMVETGRMFCCGSR